MKTLSLQVRELVQTRDSASQSSTPFATNQELQPGEPHLFGKKLEDLLGRLSYLRGIAPSRKLPSDEALNRDTFLRVWKSAATQLDNLERLVEVSETWERAHSAGTIHETDGKTTSVKLGDTRDGVYSRDRAPASNRAFSKGISADQINEQNRKFWDRK